MVSRRIGVELFGIEESTQILLLSHLDAPHVCSQFVHRLDPLVVFIRVVDNAPTSL